MLFVGGLERWRQRSSRYAEDYKRSYFDDLVELHDRLGLSVRLGTAVAMASLVGRYFLRLRQCDVALIMLSKDVSFTCRYCVQTAKHIAEILSPAGSIIILVFLSLNFSYFSLRLA